MSRQSLLFRGTLLLFILINISACKDCTCTMMNCTEGIWVNLTNIPESSSGEQYDVRFKNSTDEWQTAAASDVVDENHGGRFIDMDLLDGKPAEIELEVRLGGNVVVAAKSYSLDWKSTVCNECTGGRNCDDDMAYTSILDIPL